MSTLQLYNTLTRKKEVFKPLVPGMVGMYSCGPTVYSFPTIGNMRTYLFSDFLKRAFERAGYTVRHVMNVTDVGHLVGDGNTGADKIEEAAHKEHKTAHEIAEFYLSIFKQDMKKLHIQEPTLWCKATEHIREQIELIEQLEMKRYTYKTSDGIYFESTKFKDYGKMARLKREGLKAGTRVAMGDKHAPTDFALWKFSSQPGARQQEWKSPWGVGYPGWHIECSAMSMKYLGQHFDVHTGGEDHIPVHHTNEIAQSEAATGTKFVNYWVHGAFLTFKGEKVSKSKGGLYTISELAEEGYEPVHFRYLCLLTHYRKSLDFSLLALDAARTACERLRARYQGLEAEEGKTSVPLEKRYMKMFDDAVFDDLNLSVALSVVWRMLDDDALSNSQKRALLDSYDGVLGLGLKHARMDIVIPVHVQKLARERDEARASKQWKRADELRDAIRREGFDIEDAANGSHIKKIR